MLKISCQRLQPDQPAAPLYDSLSLSLSVQSKLGCLTKPKLAHHISVLLLLYKEKRVKRIIEQVKKKKGRKRGAMEDEKKGAEMQLMKILS